MSAYGAISAPTSAAVLPVLSWPIADGRTLTTYPVRGNDAPASVINYLYGVFSDELEGESCSLSLSVILTLTGYDCIDSSYR